MKFELWKTYKHSTGKIMKIVGMANTKNFGDCLVGEDLKTGELSPVGLTEENTVGWEEVKDPR